MACLKNCANWLLGLGEFVVTLRDPGSGAFALERAHARVGLRGRCTPLAQASCTGQFFVLHMRIAGGPKSRILRRPVAWYFSSTQVVTPDRRQPVDACTCKQTLIPAGDGIARARRESKGRGGKTVTTIRAKLLAEDMNWPPR